MPLQLEQSAELCVLTAAGFRLEFRFGPDRWRHLLSVPEAGEWRCLLESLEGEADALPPPSPVFQSLLVERKSDEVVEVQLMGQASKELYSAAVLVDGKGGMTVTFDVAVRVRDVATAAVSSSYREHPPGCDIALETVPSPGEPRILREEAEGVVRAGCSIDLSRLSLGRQGMTLRWSYRLQARNP